MLMMMLLLMLLLLAHAHHQLCVRDIAPTGIQASHRRRYLDALHAMGMANHAIL